MPKSKRKWSMTPEQLEAVKVQAAKDGKKVAGTHVLGMERPAVGGTLRLQYNGRSSPSLPHNASDEELDVALAELMREKR